MAKVELTAFSDWGWWVKPLLVPAAPVGRSLLSAVGAGAAASRGPEGGRPNLCRDLGGGRPPARSSQRDRLARRPHGNDAAPPCPAETRSPSGGRGRRLLAPAKLGAVHPDAMQDNGELAGDRDAGARDASPLGDLHAP